MMINAVGPNGKRNQMALDVTEKQLNDWKNGMLIQDAMPNLNPDEREFLISGMLPEDFNALFNPLEET